MGQSSAIELESQEPLPASKDLGLDQISHASPDVIEVINPAAGEPELEIPAVTFPALEKRPTVVRICATFWSFLVMGLNDAAYGVSNCGPK